MVSPETAQTVRNMLRAVVQRDPTGVQQGTGPAAAVEGYQIAGKTGTAQQINPACGCYYDDVYWITFAGMATTDDPRYVVGIMMDNPHSRRGRNARPLGGPAVPQHRRSWLLQRGERPAVTRSRSAADAAGHVAAIANRRGCAAHDPRLAVTAFR